MLCSASFAFAFASLCFVMLCFASFALLSFALLCYALLCFASLCMLLHCLTFLSLLYYAFCEEQLKTADDIVDAALFSSLADVYSRKDLRHIQRECARYFNATVGVMAPSPELASSDPDGSKIGTDLYYR